jgi:hypothetical protein
MDFSLFSGDGYLFIGGLLFVGVGLLLISFFVNRRVAHSVHKDERHHEKRLEYYRNTFSQLGVILIGIGVSLFIFFFQQNYQEQKRREAELQQILVKMGLRVSRAAALLESLNDFDTLLDNGGPFANPEDGGNNHAVTAEGNDLVAQVEQIQLVEWDVDVEQFTLLDFSEDFGSSQIANEVDPKMWFHIAADESEAQYAAAQLTLDYKDLADAIGDESVEAAVANPAKTALIKQEVLDVFWDADLLRDRARRLLGRACWFLSHGTGFVDLHPIEPLEAAYAYHKEWLDRAEPIYAKAKIGDTDCFQMLRYQVTERRITPRPVRVEPAP